MASDDEDRIADVANEEVDVTGRIKEVAFRDRYCRNACLDILAADLEVLRAIGAVVEPSCRAQLLGVKCLVLGDKT